MNDRKDYQQQLKNRMKLLQTEIDELKAKAAIKGEDMKQEFKTRLQQLEEKQVQVSNKLNELQNASGEAWDELKLGTELAWNQLKNAVKDAAQHFK